MRTPLNAIIGCCSLAERSCMAGDYGKLEEYIRKIRFSGRQLLDLINDILEMSRMEAGKSTLNQKELDLKKLMSEIAGIFRTVYRKAERRWKSVWTSAIPWSWEMRKNHADCQQSDVQCGQIQQSR